MTIQDGAKRTEIIEKITTILSPFRGVGSSMVAEQIYDEVVLPEILEATTGLTNALREGMQKIWWGAK
jgi:hypothetical protein